ncbi:hypothetical protein F4818DRAFT_455789 [Hypoxylon cercidicola]|nr:hypothetical protein F4818DRAFT_455789 [Hypoxylon cercidicola]
MEARALPLLRSSLESIHNDDPEPSELRLTKKWQSKAVALCKSLWPSAKHDTLSVKYLSHGSYNTVFSVSMVMADDQPVEYVLRIPDAELLVPRTAAILEYLTEFTDLKVPRVITWDATTDNSLENNYIILSRIPGKCLQEVWKDLAHHQKLILARKLAQLFLQIESVTNQVAGTIKVHKKGLGRGDKISDRMFVEAFGADVLDIPNDPINWLNVDNGLLPLDRLRHDPPNLTVSDIMLAIFRRRIYQTKNHETNSHDYLLEFFEPCQQMVEDMVDRGVFQSENDAICLHHVDIFPRNIMVDFSPDITITGVLDWDVALFAPSFAGRAPPRWLWRSVPQDDSEYAKFDMEPLDPNENEPDSPENTEIKRVFEAAVGEAWVSESTGKPYPFARRLLRFGRQDTYDGEDIGNLLEWIGNWSSVVGEKSDMSDTESLSTGVLDGSEDGETATYDEAGGNDATFNSQQDDGGLVLSEKMPALRSAVELESLEHEERQTNMEILEYDSPDNSSGSEFKNKGTIQPKSEETAEEEHHDAKSWAECACDCLRSPLANISGDRIQILRHVDSSVRRVRDWLESDASTSAATAKEDEPMASTVSYIRRPDDNELWRTAVLDWAVHSPGTSLEVRPDVPESRMTATKDGPGSYRFLRGRKIVLEGPLLYLFLSSTVVQLASVLMLGVWLATWGKHGGT